MRALCSCGFGTVLVLRMAGARSTASGAEDPVASGFANPEGRAKNGCAKPSTRSIRRRGVSLRCHGGNFEDRGFDSEPARGTREGREKEGRTEGPPPEVPPKG